MANNSEPKAFKFRAINSNMKINLFKKEKSFKKERFHFSPNALWELILCFAAITIVAGFVFGFNLFLQVNKEFVPSTENVQGQIRIVKQADIQNVLDYFSLREKKSTEIINSPSPLVDPSL